MDLCCERNCEVFIVPHNLINKLEEKTFIQNCYNQSFFNQRVFCFILNIFLLDKIFRRTYFFVILLLLSDIVLSVKVVMVYNLGKTFRLS